MMKPRSRSCTSNYFIAASNSIRCELQNICTLHIFESERFLSHRFRMKCELPTCRSQCLICYTAALRGPCVKKVLCARTPVQVVPQEIHRTNRTNYEVVSPWTLKTRHGFFPAYSGCSSAPSRGYFDPENHYNGNCAIPTFSRRKKQFSMQFNFFDTAAVALMRPFANSTEFGRYIGIWLYRET